MDHINIKDGLESKVTSTLKIFSCQGPTAYTVLLN